MICPKCLENNNSKESIFCSNCGNELFLLHNSNNEKILNSDSHLECQKDTLKLSGDSIKLYKSLKNKINELQNIPQDIEKINYKIQFKELKLAKLSNQHNELKVHPFSEEINKLNNELNYLKEEKTDLSKLKLKLDNNKNSLTKLVHDTILTSSDPINASLIKEREYVANSITLKDLKIQEQEKILRLLDSIYFNLNTIYLMNKKYLEVIDFARSFRNIPDMSKILDLVNNIIQNGMLILKLDPYFNLIQLLLDNQGLILENNINSLNYLEVTLPQLKNVLTKLQYETDRQKKDLNQLNSKLVELQTSILAQGTSMFEKAIDD